MRIKICGVTRPADARRAVELGVDFVGLIRARSARQVSLEEARRVARMLPPTTVGVLLYRDTPLEQVCTEVSEVGVKWVQLHGAEPLSYVRELHAACPDVRLIRAWEVAGPDAADALGAYLDAARGEGLPVAIVILDAPKGGRHPGYESLGEVSHRCRASGVEIWCAGGLTPANVASAVAAGDYAGVDVARGVERAPGIKDHVAMERFVAAVRALP